MHLITPSPLQCFPDQGSLEALDLVVKKLSGMIARSCRHWSPNSCLKVRDLNDVPVPKVRVKSCRFNHPLELPHITRPRPGRELTQSLWREIKHVDSIALPEPAQEKRAELRYVPRPLAQRRDTNYALGDAMVQVTPNLS